jgi:hypothetical protein
MRVAIDKYGNAGQPLWLVVPSSLYGAFLAGEERDARILAITFDASVHGWAAVLRTSPDEPGIEVVRGYRTAVDFLGSAFNALHQPGCAARLSGRAGVLGDSRRPPRYKGGEQAIPAR